MRIKVNHDLYDISGRLREIDKRYYLVWNTTSSRYEIHYEGQKNTFLISLPYARLDKRAIDCLYKSSIHKIDLADIDRQNDTLDQKNSQDMKYENNYRLREMLSFGDRVGHDISFDSHPTHWI